MLSDHFKKGLLLQPRTCKGVSNRLPIVSGRELRVRLCVAEEAVVGGTAFLRCEPQWRQALWPHSCYCCPHCGGVACCDGGALLCQVVAVGVVWVCCGCRVGVCGCRVGVCGCSV